MIRLILTALSLLCAAQASAQEGFRWVVEPGFQDAGPAHRGVVPLQEGGAWGLMDATGSWALAPQFQAVGMPGQGRFPLQRDGKWGLLTVTGTEITPFDFDAIGTPDRWTPMQWRGDWWLLDPVDQFEAEPLHIHTLIGNDGNCVVGLIEDAVMTIWRGAEPLDLIRPGSFAVQPPSEDKVPVRADGKEGHLYCDADAVASGALELDEVRGFHDGLAAARQGDAWGYVSVYDSYFEIGGDLAAAGDFAEGLAPAMDASGLWGYLDLTGNWAIAPGYDRAESFQSGLAAVDLGGKWGFLTADGAFAVRPQFDEVRAHEGGLVAVRLGDQWGVIAPAAANPATRLNLPLAQVAADQQGRQSGFSMQPSNPHHYVFQDVASVHSLQFTADSAVMVSTLALQDRAEVALWDFTSHRLIRKFAVPEATQALLLPDREVIAVGLATGHLVLLDALTGQERARIRPHDGAVIDMAMSPDGLTLATTDGATVQMWDMGEGAAAGAVHEPAHKLRFSPDGTRLFAGTNRGGLVEMDLTGTVLTRVADGPMPEYGEGPFDQALPAMALSPQGVLVNLRSEHVEQPDGFYAPVYRLEVVTQQDSRTIPVAADQRDILTVDISPDGKSVALAGSLDDEWVAVLQVVDIATGETTYELRFDQNADALAQGVERFVYSVDRLAYAPTGQVVVVGMEGQDILLIDPAARRQTADFGANLVLSQNGTAIYGGNRYFQTDGLGQIWVWDLAQGVLEDVLALEGEGFGVEEMMQVEGDRFYLYSGMEEGLIHGFDMATLEALPLSEAETAEIVSRLTYDFSQTYSPAITARLAQLPGDGFGVALASGRLAVVTETVGLNRVYDLQSGELLVEFLATPDGEWLVLTPEGFFAASENGAELVSVSTDLRAFSVDQLYQALYRPDLVQAKLAGDPQGLVAAAAREVDLSRVLGSGPAPSARFATPLDGSVTATADIEVTIELRDEGGGIGRIEWRLNGLTVEVQTRAAEALPADSSATALMTLDPGRNQIEVVAYNAQGLVASAPVAVTVTSTAAPNTVPPSLHVLAVGVNDYADGRLQLNFAANDAAAFAGAMEKAGAGLFASVEVTTLLDREVTEARLDAAFAEIGAKAGPQDVFLFFLAGHGKTVEGKYYFIPSDFRFEGPDPIRAMGIDQDRWQEWAARVKAKKSVMIYDSCESGTVTGERSVDAAMAQSAAVERLTRATGRTILSASTDTAPAMEGYRGHGVMTWALLEAFAAGDRDGNATLEVTELASYLDAKVPEISQAAFGLRQVPQMSIRGSDFALGAAVAVLGAGEVFPATLTHVVLGGTELRDAPDGAVTGSIAAGAMLGVYRIEELAGFARIAKDGRALGWVPLAALSPLQ